MAWKRIGLLGCLLPVWLMAQSGANDGLYFADKFPWNSAFLSTSLDQMVHGEEYRSYPGPLPKLFLALGQDASHPAIDFELTKLILRDAPFWWGSCNGWAVAAIAYEEPEPLVVRGIKFMPGDIKALLTSIHESDSANWLGSQDPVDGGLSPRSLESILVNRVARDGKSVILDQDYSDQSWNFPVVGFRKESIAVGEWTEVRLGVIYPQLTALNDETGQELTFEDIYQYRYRTATRDRYEWIGASKTNHPERAWIPAAPVNDWVLNTNRYYNLETYRKLLAMSQAPDRRVDLYEPNDEPVKAFALDSELAMGSLTEGDRDHFRVSLAEDETLALRFEVYDGPAADVAILDSEASPVATWPGIVVENLVFRAPRSGSYSLRIDRAEADGGDVFYQLVFPEDASAYLAPGGLGGDARELGVIAVNTRNRELPLARESVDRVPAYGSRSFTGVEGGALIRASERTVWAETVAENDTVVKRYHRDHVRRMPFVVPHLTFRNGWDTVLDLWADTADDPVQMAVFDAGGEMVERVAVPFEPDRRFHGSAKNLLGSAARARGAWFRLETPFQNRLRGTVSFVNGRGEPVVLDIESAPRIGLMHVFDLKPATDGNTGLALVNIADVAQDLLYRVEDRTGEVVGEGRIPLKPGSRWLNLVSALSEVPLTAEHTLFLHAQHPVEGLVIQSRHPSGVYGHRILSEDLDQVRETYMTLPEDRDSGALMFQSYNSGSIHVLFEGYSPDGQLQGKFNIEIGKPLRYGELRVAPLSRILSNGINIKDLDAISHFRITAAKPVYALELFGADRPNPQILPLVKVYDNP